MQTYTEYRNQNAHRNYPFADDASLVSTGGTRLPSDFLVDAFLTPIDAVGPIYLSLLDTVAMHMEFTDAGSGRVCVVADWAAGDSAAEVWSSGTTAAGWNNVGQIGLVVFGGGQVVGETLMRFTVSSAPFLATCAVPLIQPGVRGIVTQPDGLLTAGAVMLEGRNGVTVTATQDTADLATVRFDIYGTVPVPLEDCDGRPPIQTVTLKADACSKIVASNTVPAVIYLLGAGGFELSETCKKSQIPDPDGTLPSAKTPCVPGPAPTPWECAGGAYTPIVVPITTGFLTIAAPATLTADNPFTVRTEESAGETIDASMPDAAVNLAQQTRRVQQLLSTGIRPSGRITIAMRGAIR